MLNRFITAAAVALALACGGFAYAAEGPSKALDARIKISGAFLGSAVKITSQGKSKEATAILRLAEESYAEALGHIKSGEYEFASEDLTDATTKATHAIILATTSDDRSIWDVVMKEEVALLEEREHDRKETRLKKSIAEVDIFVKTAERLLKESPNEKATAKLAETRAVYKASKEKIASGDYDGAQTGITQAYNLATASVKMIKHSQGDILTFPKAEQTDQKDILAHELKKNDAYTFFASVMIKEDAGDPSKLVTEGLAYRDGAMKALADGVEAKAIESLKTSTELFIRALKSYGR